MVHPTLRPTPDTRPSVCVSTAAVEDVVICVQSWGWTIFFFFLHSSPVSHFVLRHHLTLPHCVSSLWLVIIFILHRRSAALLLSSSDVMFAIVHYSQLSLSLPALHSPLLPQLHSTFLWDQSLLRLELHVLILSYNLVITFSPAVSLCVWLFVWMFLFFFLCLFRGNIWRQGLFCCFLFIHDGLKLQ